ncbi:MAG: LEA type 2 family protein [Desulfofustis sp.]
MRNQFVLFTFATLLLFILSGCAVMQSGYDPPSVSLTSFRFIPGDSIVPKFEVGLRILNPNRDALELEGLFYSISIADNDIISGVANELPIIEGYGEEDILLEAVVDVIGGAKLLQSLLRSQKGSIDYGFTAKLDLGALQPPLRVSEKGEFSLSDLQ